MGAVRSFMGVQQPAAGNDVVVEEKDNFAERLAKPDIHCARDRRLVDSDPSDRQIVVQLGECAFGFFFVIRRLVHHQNLGRRKGEDLLESSQQNRFAPKCRNNDCHYVYLRRKTEMLST